HSSNRGKLTIREEENCVDTLPSVSTKTSNQPKLHPMKKNSDSHSAPVRRSLSEGGFFKLRVLVGVLLAFAAITVVLFALGKASAQPRTAPGISQPTISAQYRGVMPVVKFDISPPLRKMKPQTWKECTKDENEDR